MSDFIIAFIIIFAIGSCKVRKECAPDKEGKTYKWCNHLFEKVKYQGGADE